MKIKFGILVLGMALFSCGGSTDGDTDNGHASLSDLEVKDVETYDLAIDQDLINNIHGFIDQDCEKLDLTVYTWSENPDEDSERTLDEGVIFKKVPETIAFEVFSLYSDDVEAEGNYLFLTNIDFDENWDTFYDVVILPCEDQFELIELMGVNGLNYDIYTDEVVQKMREWDEEIGFDIIFVDDDGVEAFMSEMPRSIETFAAEVYDFCPDVIDQGSGDMETYIQDLQDGEYFWLWWD